MSESSSFIGGMTNQGGNTGVPLVPIVGEGIFFEIVIGRTQYREQEYSGV